MFLCFIGIFGRVCFLFGLVFYVVFGHSIISSRPAKAQGISVEVEVQNTHGSKDDYLCWSPQPARARILGSPTGNVTARIVSEKTSSVSTGKIVFDLDSGDVPKWDTFTPREEISIALPANGDWISFYVAGKVASTNQKDVAIVVRNVAGGGLLGSIPVMIRVRKDARTMTRTERMKFLDAVRKLHDAGHFDKYWRAHQTAFNYDIHGMFRSPFPPLFLAWHRAFLLNFERELQQLDPDVSLPYWKFDEPSSLAGGSSIFSSDFLGAHVSGSSIVQFDDNLAPTPNPWNNWRTSVSTRPLERSNHPDRRNPFTGVIEGPVSAGALDDILSSFGKHSEAGGEIEFGYHNGAHGRILGWIGRGYSPADPLFFLLHSNVDRGFAHWQAQHDAWDHTGTDSKTYHATGSYPGTGADYLKGSYALDEMWPWNPGQPGWPSGMFFQMPSGLNGSIPAGVPTPASQIDYLNLSGTAVASGACYDDIGYVR